TRRFQTCPKISGASLISSSGVAIRPALRSVVGRAGRDFGSDMGSSESRPALCCHVPTLSRTRDLLDQLTGQFRSVPSWATASCVRIRTIMPSASPSDTHVTVTGASGFIALHCVRELLTRGYRVRGTVRNLASEAALRRALLPLDPGDHLSFVAAELLSDAG